MPLLLASWAHEVPSVNAAGYTVGPMTSLIWYVIFAAACWMLVVVGFFPAAFSASMNMSAAK